MAPSADFLEFLKDQLRGLGHITSAAHVQRRRHLLRRRDLRAASCATRSTSRSTTATAPPTRRRGWSRSPTRPGAGPCESAPTGACPSACSTIPTRWSSGRGPRWRPGSAPRRKEEAAAAIQSQGGRGSGEAATDAGACSRPSPTLSPLKNAERGSHRPHRRVRAERHRRAGPDAPASRRARAAWRTKVRRPNGVSISSSRSAMSADLGSGQAKPFVEAAEAREPVAGLRQRDAHVPRAALARLARQRHHRPERHQIARGVVERLGGQLLGPRQTPAASASAWLMPLAVCTSESKPRRAAQGPAWP